MEDLEACWKLRGDTAAEVTLVSGYGLQMLAFASSSVQHVCCCSSGSGCDWARTEQRSEQPPRKKSTYSVSLASHADVASQSQALLEGWRCVPEVVARVLQDIVCRNLLSSNSCGTPTAPASVPPTAVRCDGCSKDETKTANRCISLKANSSMDFRLSRSRIEHQEARHSIVITSHPLELVVKDARPGLIQPMNVE